MSKHLDTAERSAMSSVDEFCGRNGISRSFFYKLCSQGLGPRVVKLGTRTLITSEDEIQWRIERQREAVTAADN